MNYFLTNDFREIVAGTNNTIVPSFMEATKSMNNNEKSKNLIHRFLKSIESIAKGKKVRDERIASSKGDIKKFVAYEKLMDAISFIDKNAPGVELMKDLKMILKKLEEFQSYYEKGYEKQIRLIMFEYENSVYMLVTGISLILANSIDFEMNRYSLKVNKQKGAMNNKVSVKIIEDLASQLSHFKHKEYLDTLIKAVDEKVVDTNIKESVYVESVITDTMELIDVIFNNVGKMASFTATTVSNVKNSIFGIVPIIRSIIYLRYKRKADVILSLEQQVNDIQKNIEQLQNIKTMDPAKKEEIIKKQKVIIAQYKKRAEKLKAQLLEGEKEASQELQKSNDDIKNDKDDDFVFEYLNISDIFDNDKEDLFSESFNRSKKKRSFDNRESMQKNSFLEPIKDWWEEVNKKAEENIRKHEEEKRKKKEEDEEKKDPTKKEVKENLKKAIEEFKKDTAIKAIKFTCKYANTDPENKRTSSKLGGYPYWPADKPYPKMKGEDAILLYQINFAEMPKLEGYPYSGILQIFTPQYSAPEFYSEDTLCIYHKSILPEEKRLNNIPVSTLNLPNDLVDDVEGYFIQDGNVIYITGEEFDDYMNPIIEEYDETITKYLEKYVPNYKDYQKDVEDILWDELYPEKNKLGGYPWSIQIGYNMKEVKESPLLLNLESDEGIIYFGDGGIINISMKKKDLSNLKFENSAYFYWDCY